MDSFTFIILVSIALLALSILFGLLSRRFNPKISRREWFAITSIA